MSSIPNSRLLLIAKITSLPGFSHDDKMIKAASEAIKVFFMTGHVDLASLNPQIPCPLFAGRAESDDFMLKGMYE
jgi:hypothetical protein